ncbi:MAG: hypothetical protein IKU12_05510, partial [Oscillospiraceae bacterium]|nr:hypothetical protein [Oscillospiraceae bacterium]
MKTKLNKERAFQIGISILVAVIVWLFAGSVDPVDSTVWVNNIEIEYVGEDTTLAEKGLMLLGESDRTVSLKLKGERNVIYKLDTKKVRVQVELDSVNSTGVQTLKYNMILPSGVPAGSISIADASAYAATVYVGELYKKTVDVRYEVIGTVAEGFMQGDIVITPAALEIRGQQEDILQVKYAKVTIDVTGATSTIAALYDYQLYDYNNSPVENENLHVVEDAIQISVPVLQVKEVPLTVKFTESPGYSADNVNWSIDHTTIHIAGEAADLVMVNEVVLDTIDLSKVDTTSAHSTYSYEINLPKDIFNEDDFTKAVVKVNFIDFATETLTVDHFVCANVPEGFEATVLTNSLNVTVCGVSGDVADISAADVDVLLDLSALESEAGTYTVPAEISVKG